MKVWQASHLSNRYNSRCNVANNFEMLEVEVLKLSAANRLQLLERLIASFDANPEVIEGWIQEATRRDAELESGAVRVIPGEQALARLRTHLR
jgi:putative addiction module component (TIGR02574 family)